MNTYLPAKFQQRCRPAQLSVGGYFLRRGGIDINPYRSNTDETAFNVAEAPTVMCRSYCRHNLNGCARGEARAVIGQWLEEYNTIRPHGSLNGRSPAQFIEDWAEPESTLTRKQQTGNP